MAATQLTVRGQISFTDVAAESGVRFVLENSATPQKHMIETMPGGLAIFDYDNDGKADIFFTNGAALPSLEKSAPKHWNRLYRNLGNWKFEDVTESAGVAGTGYSMGAAAADFDNDGNTDLFVAGVNRNQLLRNLGNGKFVDITAASAIKSNEWGVAAGWFDYDGDGRLDLFVANYGRWSIQMDRFCGDSARKLRIYCHPKYFEPRPNQLYRNLGNGKFEDVSLKTGVAAHRGRAMSVVFGDYDDDGRVDVFVTNDNLPNFLFRNGPNGKFEETALLAGVALPDNGKPVASMGADWRDYDKDGRADIVITALSGETFPLFRGVAKGEFREATQASRLARLSNEHAGWGVGFVDMNNDGLLDLFTANSHVNDVVEQVEKASYKQANTVFLNSGGGKFELGAELSSAVKAHRGASFADLDGDGRVDVVVSVLGEPAEIWRNDSKAGNWLGVRLISTKGNRQGIGAQVRVGDQVQMMSTSTSYASSVPAALHFGLGATGVVPRIEVRWPSGKSQVLTDVKAGQTVTITESAN